MGTTAPSAPYEFATASNQDSEKVPDDVDICQSQLSTAPPKFKI